VQTAWSRGPLAGRRASALVQRLAQGGSRVSAEAWATGAVEQGDERGECLMRRHAGKGGRDASLFGIALGQRLGGRRRGW
jgi:hypothetical protein